MRVTVIATGFPADSEEFITPPRSHQRMVAPRPHAKPKTNSATGRNDLLMGAYTEKQFVRQERSELQSTNEINIHEEKIIQDINISETQDLTDLTFDSLEKDDTRVIEGATHPQNDDEQFELGGSLVRNIQTFPLKTVGEQSELTPYNLTHPADQVGKPAFDPDPLSKPVDESRTKFIDSLLMGENKEEQSIEASIQDESAMKPLFEDSNESQNIAVDIDQKIDEALELANRISDKTDDQKDDLDVPAFLRNGMKDLPLS